MASLPVELLNSHLNSGCISSRKKFHDECKREFFKQVGTI